MTDVYLHQAACHIKPFFVFCGTDAGVTDPPRPARRLIASAPGPLGCDGFMGQAFGIVVGIVLGRLRR
ncbi:MAG: hypothetical protein VW520_04220 [Candidatus Puniceispirillum sp.]